MGQADSQQGLARCLLLALSPGPGQDSWLEKIHLAFPRKPPGAWRGGQAPERQQAREDSCQLPAHRGTKRSANSKAQPMPSLVAPLSDTTPCPHAHRSCLGTTTQLLDGNSPPQEQLGVVLTLQVLLDEVGEELLQHARGVLHLPLQRRHDEGGHVAAVPHGEAPLGLQGADEGQQEVLLVQQLPEEGQGLLHVRLDLQG